MLDVLASFTTPENISTTPYTLLWALPLLLGICIVVKAVKHEKFEFAVLSKEAAKLFLGSTLVLVLLAIILGLLVEFIN
jgi:uncharacterized membrane protein